MIVYIIFEQIKNMADPIEAPSTVAEQPTTPTPSPEQPVEKAKPQIFESPKDENPTESWEQSLSNKKKAAKEKNKAAEPASVVESPKEGELNGMTTPKEEPKASEGEPPAETAKPTKKNLKKFLNKKEGEVITDPAKSETPAPAAKVELPKEVETELNQLRAILNKPSVKMVLQAEESGKDFSTYYEELKSRDPYKLPYDTLYKMQLEDQGLVESEITRKMERFAEMDEDDQLDRIATFRKAKKEAFDAELKNYTPSTAAPEPQENKWETQVMPAYQNAVNNYQNKELNGIMVTPQEAGELSNFYKNNTLVKMKDGMPDPEDLARVTHLVKNYDLIVNQIYESGFNEGLEKLQEEVTQPLNAKTGSHTTQPRKTQSDTEKRIANLKASLPNQPTAK